MTATTYRWSGESRVCLAGALIRAGDRLITSGTRLLSREVVVPVLTRPNRGPLLGVADHDAHAGQLVTVQLFSVEESGGELRGTALPLAGKEWPIAWDWDEQEAKKAADRIGRLTTSKRRITWEK